MGEIVPTAPSSISLVSASRARLSQHFTLDEIGYRWGGPAPRLCARPAASSASSRR